MKAQARRLSWTVVTVTMLSIASPLIPTAMAQTAPDLSKTEAIANSWWFHGTVEAGGRFFLNDPQRNGSRYLNQGSLAKYYEYSTIKPGPFSNIWLSTGSKDGLYQIDLGGLNIGYSDQQYYFDASKAGEHYFDFVWDQTPHVYSTNAQTPYLGVGSNALTLPTALQGKLAVGNAAGIAPYLNSTEIGIERDTASATYRWTPTDAWDIKADYSHMARTGTQVDGVVGFGSVNTTTGNPIQVPKPVNDTTQNYGVNGEYVGTSPWGQKISFKAGYTGSQYTDNFSAYTIQDPFVPVAGTSGSPTQMSLWPSNQANGFSGTVAADLPIKSRYVGTVSYTMMRQNDAFQPMCFTASNGCPVSFTNVNTLPANSLNGAINTTLSNNQITTQITPELRSKLSYRYYDYQNDTPEILFNSWRYYDSSTAGSQPVSSLSIGYTKQNAGEELNWRPSREWNLTAAYGFERYNYMRTDVNVTNESSGKLSADWKPTSWLTTRASGYYSNRRYDTYDYRDFVKAIQTPQGATTYTYSTGYRQLMFDNRQRTKANFAIDLVAFRGVTISPNFKYQDDNYGLNAIDQNHEQGLNDSRSVAAGVDVGYVVNRDLSITVGYLREHYHQLFYGLSSGNVPNNRFGTTTADIADVDTFTSVINYAVIPSKFDLDLRYMLSRGVDQTQLLLSTNALPTGGQIPNDTTWFQRLDAVGTYTLDPTFVHQMGWKGDIKAKLHYTWEKNYVNNWQNDSLSPYNNPNFANAIFLAYDNPNYNVQMIAASLAATW